MKPAIGDQWLRAIVVMCGLVALVTQLIVVIAAALTCRFFLHVASNVLHESRHWRAFVKMNVDFALIGFLLGAISCPVLVVMVVWHLLRQDPKDSVTDDASRSIDLTAFSSRRDPNE
jgi:hypothetical protein